MVEAGLQDWNRKITHKDVELSKENDEKHIENCDKTPGNKVRRWKEEQKN